ncbi:replication protein [Cronobacter sakazakii]|nr:replication protein [Cronobacter sakazakii]
MRNLAEVHDLTPHIEARERRVAELEDGYTRIANDLLEAVMLAGLTQHQLLVFMAVMRKTYGFNKKVDWISNEQLSQLTGMLPHKCSAAKSTLVKRKILSQSGRQVGINKAIGEWEKEHYLNQVTLPESGKKSLPESGKRSYPNQVNTKETITKEKKETTPLPPEGGDGQGSKPEKRKAIRIDYQAFLLAYNEEVGEMLPHAVELNDSRKRRLKKLIPQLKTPNADGWRAYVRAFVHQAKPFYFGENDSGWSADIDYLLRDATLTGVREGKFAGKEMT